MANYPKKMMDPTEAALSAIQEALNIRDDDETAQPEAQEERRAQAEDSPEGMADLFAGDARSRRQSAQTQAVPQPIYDEHDDTDAIGTRDLSALPGQAANDDQQSIGQVLRALQRRPARSSYFVATAFSAPWLVGQVRWPLNAAGHKPGGCGG